MNWGSPEEESDETEHGERDSGSSLMSTSSRDSFFSSLRRAASQSLSRSNRQSSVERLSIIKRKLSSKGVIEPWLTEPISHEGFLKKLSTKGFWQIRWCELRGPLILYWKTKEASREKLEDGTLSVSMPDAAIDLRIVLNIALEQNDLILGFLPHELRARKGSLHLRVESEDYVAWTTAVQSTSKSYIESFFTI
jgi:hypothetical protein